MRSARAVRYIALLASALAGLVLSLDPAGAQSLEELRGIYRLQLPPVAAVPGASLPALSPGSSANTPTAFGPNQGDLFAGAGFQARTRYAPAGRDGWDGAAVVGFGLGNAHETLGLEVAMTLISTFDSGFFDKTSFSFKLHRALPGNGAIALGWENAFVVGEGTDGGRSLYMVGSKLLPLGNRNYLDRLTASVGIGNGRFRFEEDVRAGIERVNLFASAGLQLVPNASLIADWTGQDLTLAASIVPFRRLPLVITPGIADLTGSAGDGARFILGAGMSSNLHTLSRIFP